MKFSTIFSSALLLSSHYVSAQSSQIANDIQSIDRAVRNFITTLSSYQGGINESGPTVLSILAIHAVNRQSYTNAQSSPKLTPAQSHQVVTATQNTVGKSIPQAIQLTKDKKPLFDSAQLSSLVQSTLALLQYDHDIYSLVVGSKLDGDSVLSAGVAAASISKAIAGGQAYYAL